ncbi:S8 family peptidase [Olivibacter sp. CPCC 100613]|uniref:S8 family peptidase n=1 Tax=Olivibacter sp. CPCC 100613 TaxID=3079931 RepID=UPI002FFD1B60
MPENSLDHLFLDERFYKALSYTSVLKGGASVLARSDINRELQGDFVKVRFNEAIEDFKEGRDETDFVYLVFKSAINFELDLDKFDDKSSFRIAYVKTITEKDSLGQEFVYYESAIFLNRDAISSFLRKIEEFLTEFSWQSLRKNNPKPKNFALIANIEDIRAATLESFWQEPELPFPPSDEVVWWEVWLDKKHKKDVKQGVLAQLAAAGIQIGQQWIDFPEHTVGLIKASARRLSETLLYSDSLSELRKPRETAEFFTYLNRADQHEWIDDLRKRVQNLAGETTISVCLLDSGLTRGNPLLKDLVAERNLDTILPEVDVADNSNSSTGHGTPMAGLILYGDLSDVLATKEEVKIFHHLESVKIIHPNHPHDPDNRGWVTMEAVSKAITINPAHKRIVCLAVTADDVFHKGRPTAWSAAIDQLSFGNIEEPNNSTLFMVSSGNLLDEQRNAYPIVNEDCSINDPAQAFNAITVGAYTLKDYVDLDKYPNAEVLARRGAMSPCNTTSIIWENTWCRKPEIVMEGGNQALQHQGVLTPDSMQLLSTSKGTTLTWLTTFGDTSGATALASRFAAQVYTRYPKLWPETIRALIIHTADWTSEMLGEDKKHIRQLKTEQKPKLLQTVGYGVPNLPRALHSVKNSLSLIAEAILKPYKQEKSRIKTDQFHLYQLPWPREVLSELFEAPVRLIITLSYFIEPNPGNKRYAEARNYMSHGLRFKMIDKDESPESFAGRISSDMQEEDYEKEGKERDWLLGDKLRNKGSIHKDIWEGTAADLATRNVIAIYPVGGWWKKRKKLERYLENVRYSLIVTVEAPNNDVDIYSVVKSQIDIAVPITIEI